MIANKCDFNTPLPLDGSLKNLNTIFNHLFFILKGPQREIAVCRKAVSVLEFH